MELRGFIGNEGIRRTLSGGLPRSHAWIISGPAGSGRHTLAGIMASAFVCGASGGQPCGKCPHCRKTAEGIHPDVAPVARFMRQEDVEKDRELRVEAVRALRSDAFIRPNEAARKVYLIDRPLSVQDQNALLKLLEEGPEYAVFLLLTENAASLLETVRSRCTELVCAPVGEEEALAFLRARYPQAGEDALRRAAASCGGLLGQAAALLEAPEEEDSLAAWIAQWTKALTAGSEYALMECSVQCQLRLAREELSPFYRRMEEALHRGLLAACGAGEPSPLSGLDARRLVALERLAEEGRQSCACYLSPGQSLGWFAARCWEILSA